MWSNFMLMPSMIWVGQEALLVLEFCEKSLVSVLESPGAGYFDEKQVLLIFRDVCNAVFAMHCQSPPIAHRDLKADNILLSSDGLWKLCDFGSISTNHNMWDLFLKEVINEKVDIRALGCLLFRICYFKSAFDGESKLQVLNGNYRIPDLPKFSSTLTDLIRDMLQSKTRYHAGLVSCLMSSYLLICKSHYLTGHPNHPPPTITKVLQRLHTNQVPMCGRNAPPPP